VVQAVLAARGPPRAAAPALHATTRLRSLVRRRSPRWFFLRAPMPPQRWPQRRAPPQWALHHHPRPQVRPPRSPWEQPPTRRHQRQTRALLLRPQTHPQLQPSPPPRLHCQRRLRASRGRHPTRRSSNRSRCSRCSSSRPRRPGTCGPCGAKRPPPRAFLCRPPVLPPPHSHRHQRRLLRSASSSSLPHSPRCWPAHLTSTPLLLPLLPSPPRVVPRPHRYPLPPAPQARATGPHFRPSDARSTPACFHHPPRPNGAPQAAHRRVSCLAAHRPSSSSRCSPTDSDSA